MFENFQGDSWGSIPPLCMPSLFPHDLCHGRSASRWLSAVIGFQLSYSRSWKMMLWKVLHSIFNMHSIYNMPAPGTLFFPSKNTLIPDVMEKNGSNIFFPKGRLFPRSKFYHDFLRSHHYLGVKNLYEHFLDGSKLPLFILSLLSSRKHTYPCKQLGRESNYLY